MPSKLLVLLMFPSCGSCQHGLPLLGRVRAPPSSPTSSLVFSPPTSRAPSASAPVPLAVGLPSGRVLILIRKYAVTRSRAPVGDCLFQAPRRPDLSQGMNGISQFAGPSSSCAPRPNTPPDAPSPSPLNRRAALLPSGVLKPSASGRSHITRLHYRGSHARAPTHQQTGYPESCKARYRPAGLSLGRVGFAPTGRLTEFH